MQINIPQLKEELRKQGIKTKIADLLALAPKNDPFGVFTESRIAAAEWAAQVWHDMGNPYNLHIRRMHYWTLPCAVLKPDGTLYMNTDHDWHWLCDAVKYARYRDLISVGALIDQRNPHPTVYANYAPDVCDVRLPSLRYNPGVSINFSSVHGSVAEYADEIIYPVDGIEAAFGVESMLWMMTMKTEGNEIKQNGVFVMVRYYHGATIPNSVRMAMEGTFGEFVCSSIVSESADIRNATVGFGREGEYVSLCREISEKINQPRSNLFDYVARVGFFNEYVESLAEIQKSMVGQSPTFRTPDYGFQY